MPIFEYRCTDCEKHLEVLQKQGEGARRKCPACGGKLEKLVSRTAFHLKGGGWYDQGYDKSKSAPGSSAPKKSTKTTKSTKKASTKKKD